MTDFSTTMLPADPDALAPDGSEVRLLARLERGSMAHFRLAAGQVARAVVHRTVEEIWFVVSGHGEMWRSLNGRAEITALSSGLSVTIPVGTAFQFRAAADDALGIVGITMPPWPGPEEAVFVAGPWVPTV